LADLASEGVAVVLMIIGWQDLISCAPQLEKAPFLTRLQPSMLSADAPEEKGAAVTE
jgi:hypothetical protein